MKEKYDKFVAGFKKVWADERGKSLIKLGIYVLFAVFAVITATATYRTNDTGSDEIDVPVDVMEQYSSKTSYGANYIIDDMNYEYTSSIKQMIKIGDFSYYITDGKLVNTLDATLEVPTFEFKFWYLTPSFISDLIENGEESYTTTYKDGNIVTSYLVPLEYFVSNYDGTVLAIENNSILAAKKIEIVTTETAKEIVKVEINLSTYYVLINNQITNYNVEIDYK